MRWAITETKEVIRYNAQDGSPAKISPILALKHKIKGLMSFRLTRYFETRFPDW
ncbi:hypothetical protein ROBYS_07230 [Roseobacter sp. OBYS 0001]|nr:hypothetical protein ROBYS_07230 [Roseobacter sp. OBYS 0001]